MHKTTNLLVALLLVAGCQSQSASSKVKQVSVSELGKETDHLVFFNYIGSDADFDYFTTAEDKHYKVSGTEWANPAKFKLVDGNKILFMTVKDGKLSVPDPSAMATLSDEDLLHVPYKKK